MSEWLNRDLVVGPYLRLCLSQEDFDAACEAIKVPGASYLNEGAQATTHFMGRGDDGGRVCLVCLRLPPPEGTTGVQIASILVHEAVHVWQEFVDAIGERNPSSEFEAYSIQMISLRLMQSYVDQTTKEQP